MYKNVNWHLETEKQGTILFGWKVFSLSGLKVSVFFKLSSDSLVTQWSVRLRLTPCHLAYPDFLPEFANLESFEEWTNVSFLWSHLSRMFQNLLKSWRHYDCIRVEIPDFNHSVGSWQMDSKRVHVLESAPSTSLEWEPCTEVMFDTFVNWSFLHKDKPYIAQQKNWDNFGSNCAKISVKATIFCRNIRTGFSLANSQSSMRSACKEQLVRFLGAE